MSIIPYLGVALSLIPAFVLAMIQFVPEDGWLKPVLILVWFAAVQAMEGLFISPKIIGDRVGLHPLTIIVAVMVGTTLLGGRHGRRAGHPVDRRAADADVPLRLEGSRARR